MSRWLLVALGVACRSTEPPIVEPGSGSMAGYYEVRVATSFEARTVRVGDVGAIDVRSDGEQVRFRVQGHPTPGAVDIVLRGPDGSLVLESAFTYDPPEPGFEKVVSIGASLAQGVQGGVPTQHGQLHSPSRWVARAAGAYHPPPLLVPGLFPPITGAEITAAPDCDAPGVVDHLTNAAIDVLQKLNDVEEDRIGFYLGLENPDLLPYNLAVGNSGVSTILHGPDPDDFAQQFLSKLVFDIDGDIGDPVPGSQLEIVEAMEPTVILCADTYGNDLLGWRPIEEVEPDMEALLERLAATGAEVFLANIPRPTLLPRSGANAERDELSLAYVEALDRQAARHANVHVVDLASDVERWASDGLVVGDGVLELVEYGGLISTDGLHLTDVGYAHEANLFLAAIEEAMGVSLDPVDLGVVHETDEHSPNALLEQGIDPDCLP